MGRGEDINTAIARHDNAGAAPKIGDVIVIELTALDGGLPLRLKGVVRYRATDGFRVEFLADTPDERRELSLFRQFLRAAEGYTDA